MSPKSEKQKTVCINVFFSLFVSVGDDFFTFLWFGGKRFFAVGKKVVQRESESGGYFWRETNKTLRQFFGSPLNRFCFFGKRAPFFVFFSCCELDFYFRAASPLPKTGRTVTFHYFATQTERVPKCCLFLEPTQSN